MNQAYYEPSKEISDKSLDLHNQAFDLLDTLFEAESDHTALTENEALVDVVEDRPGEEDSNSAVVGMVKLDDGYLVITDFPGQDVFKRIYALQPDSRRITYIEPDNDNLTNLGVIDYGYPDRRSMELSAMPEDVRLLSDILSKVTEPQRMTIDTDNSFGYSSFAENRQQFDLAA